MTIRILPAPLSRRLVLLACSTALLAGCALPLIWGGDTPSLTEAPPIVFVHGNGDTAALWQTTLWRFESNGWPRSRLHAIEVPYPLARDDDSKALPDRAQCTEKCPW